MNMTLHNFIDFHFGVDGESVLRQRLDAGEPVNAFLDGETPLHVAVRRRRNGAAEILLEYGAEINLKNAHGKTAYAHAIRRGFVETAELLSSRGASPELNAADRLAVAVVSGRLDGARAILAEHPRAARTGNPEEDRLLADVAGRQNSEAVILLIAAGADLAAPGLDSGTPLHQAAWFGQPANARLLIDAGAPLDIFDNVHNSSPLGWAVHGSRYSGDADRHQAAYEELVQMLLDAGSSLHYPDQPDTSTYLTRLRTDATPGVLARLPEIP
ncbi:MAG: ankyrin repeat domain-containing protein [Planctomycetaceae bacterium]